MKTADHFSFHPKTGLVRANVQETTVVAGVERDLPGQDVDVKIDDLPSELRSAIEDVVARLSAFLNVPAAAPLLSELEKTALRAAAELAQAEALAVEPSRVIK